jgi:hypothetical protein
VATIVATGHRNQGVRSLQSTRPRVLHTKDVRDSVTRDTVVEKGADKAGVTSDRIPKLDRPEVLYASVPLTTVGDGVVYKLLVHRSYCAWEKGCIQAPDSVGSDRPLAMLEPICTAWTSSIFRAGYDPNCDDGAIASPSRTVLPTPSE